jgi:hypothetical protein
MTNIQSTPNNYNQYQNQSDNTTQGYTNSNLQTATDKVNTVAAATKVIKKSVPIAQEICNGITCAARIVV